MSIKQAIEARSLYEVTGDIKDINTVLIDRAALAALRSMPAEPYGQVTVVKRPGCQDLHWFYRWPDPPYLDNASECVTVYATPHTEAVRMSEAEINHLVDTHVGGPTPSYPLGPEDWINFARAVEQATAARLGVKWGDV